LWIGWIRQKWNKFPTVQTQHLVLLLQGDDEIEDRVHYGAGKEQHLRKGITAVLSVLVKSMQV